MIERYYSHPDTVERIHSSWIGKAVEDYVCWLTERQYSARTVLRRIPIVMRFGRFAEAQGVTSLDALPPLVEPFVSQWLRERVKGRRTSTERRKIGDGVRNVIDQVLVLALPGYREQGRRAKPENPFHESVPAFFDFLRDERGLSESSLLHYRFYLGQFGRYLDSIGLNKLCDLSPVVISGFITDLSPRIGWQTLRNACGTLRVFLRYLCRQGVLARDLSPSVQFVQQYRLSSVPRSISWEDVTRMLAAVDQRLAYGRRDYAILLLLVTYGLRAREVAALTIEDIDWRAERIHIRERKAGHNTTYPLSPLVGQAILAYLQHGRPQTTCREVFLRSMAPYDPLTHYGVSCRASRYLHSAGVTVPRPGSHTLRHTCVQHLVDAHFSLKTIGDYVGHRSPSSTQVYAKIDVEGLREVVSKDGEEVV